MARVAHTAVLITVLGITGALAPPAAAAPAAGSALVSVAADGGFAPERSWNPAVSADGRFVAFESFAENIVPDDSNDHLDVFVRDQETGQTTRVSVGMNGAQADSYSSDPSISADGRYVAFGSAASNLVPGDTNDDLDVFVYDRQAGTTTLASVAADGARVGWHDGSDAPSISADGQVVAFKSEAKLVPGDTNYRDDVYVRDLAAGETRVASVSSTGVQSDRWQYYGPKISADGRFVAFDSQATNLVPGDTNGVSDIFVHDRRTHSTVRASVDNFGAGGNDSSSVATISADGRYVAFESRAANLVEGDTGDGIDLFVRDLKDGVTTRENVSPAGKPSQGSARNPVISGDGTKLAFTSSASDLVPTPRSTETNVYVRDRGTGAVTRASVGPDGAPASRWCGSIAFSQDGGTVAWVSDAGNLVAGDTNGRDDVFSYRLPQ